MFTGIRNSVRQAKSKNVAIIFNPVCSGRDSVEAESKISTYLNALGCSASFLRTTRASTGKALATEALNRGFDTIIAAGGDGTIMEVIYSLVG